MNKGQIRIKAEYLLDMLSVAYLKNLTENNIEDIKNRLNDIKKSDINWETDVVKSVRIKYDALTNDDTINTHMEKWKN
jgi:hypothetical protein